jgi:Cof subfamily protein (haloacid dehalogenase superfamily)
MKKQDIKLIALDLDGTTLTSNRGLTKRTREAIENAVKRGVNVIIATGRAYSALPPEIFEVDGLRYIVTSNGANVRDILKDEKIYSNCIDPLALEGTVSLLKNYDFMLEVFIDGYAYVEQRIYNNIHTMNFMPRHKEYIKETRKPVADLLGFTLEHKGDIENINVNFENQTDRSMMRVELATLENVTITTSFDHNLEVGGATTSKADAIKMLCKMFGIAEADVMACGDSPNDMEMLVSAGFPVAMENAKDELKAIAKHITASNDDDGVAIAIEKFVLI